MLALIGAVQQQLQKKKADINQKYDKQDLDQQEQHDVLLAELTINNETARQVAVLKIKKHYAELALKQLTDSGKDENSVEVLNAKKLIQDLDGQLKEVGDKAGKGFSLKSVVSNIFKSFGANDTDAGAAADAAGEAMSSIMENMTSALTDGVDRIIEERQRLIDSLDDQISAVEESLDKEKELQEQGYANNVTIEQQKLDALKAQREKALKEEEEAQKKKANLQKLQIVLDSQAQVTNLITASTDIFASLSKIPFVGVPLAIGLNCHHVWSLCCCQSECI
jgi:hypothetical protein